MGRNHFKPCGIGPFCWLECSIGSLVYAFDFSSSILRIFFAAIKQPFGSATPFH